MPSPRTILVERPAVSETMSNLTRVNVDTNDGTVYLIGTVETDDQRTRAEQLAREAKGVKIVPAGPEEVASAIRRLDPERSGIRRDQRRLRL